MADQSANPPVAGSFERSEDFRSRYANSFQFEQTAFDIKLLFGELTQRGGDLPTVWHTSITLPLVQAKLMSYFLQVNIAAFELQNGKIKIPENLMPPPVGPIQAGQEPDPSLQELVRVVSEIRDRFVRNLQSE